MTLFVSYDFPSTVDKGAPPASHSPPFHLTRVFFKLTFFCLDPMLNHGDDSFDPEKDGKEEDISDVSDGGDD